ncbi:hypothetical protein V7068_17720 [Bacillus sp. JJ634]
MKWLFALGITFLVACMILYEWPKMKQNQKKEKKVFIVLVTFEWLFSLIFLFYPDLKNPSDFLLPMVDKMQKILK